MNRKLIDSIRMHEGLRLESYQDSEGVWTIGYGRNLQELRIDPLLAERWLRDDIGTAIIESRTIPEYDLLNTVARRNVFIEMVFNLGKPRLLRFRRMLAAIREGDYNTTADEMLDSRWAKQVGRRAQTLAQLMRQGTYDNN